jgi:DNA-binding FadR family transcriptional regulator
MASLQEAVNAAYQALTAAITSGDPEQISAARDSYAQAQKALEQARMGQ